MAQTFIIEGPDGAGKTTLAKNIMSHLRDPKYVHLGPPKPWENLLHHYALVLYEAHIDNRPTVIDRLHLGESIYGPLLRKTDRLGPMGYKLLNRMISGYGVIEILCLPPYEIARENWRRNMKNELVKDGTTYSAIYSAYEFLTDRPNVVVYDFSKRSSITPLSLAGLRVGSLPGGTIGSRNPKFLFVGDIANHEDLDAPFIALNGSSQYLNECIESAGYTEDQIAFVNSTSLDKTKVRVTEVWEHLNKPVTVCLGNNAKAATKHPVYQIPHPAYWKRFHAAKKDHYVNLLSMVRKAVCS